MTVLSRNRGDYSLGSANSNLECTGMRMIILIGDLLSDIISNESTAITKAVTIPLNIRIANTDLVSRQFTNFFGGSETLTSAGILFENVFFLFKITHAADNIMLRYSVWDLGQEPAGVVF